MSHKAFRASLTLAAAGYIGAADAIVCRQFPLGPGPAAIEAIPLLDDVHLPLGQALLDEFAQPGIGVLGIQRLHHGVLHPYHIQEEQAVPVLICLQRIGEGYLPLKFFLGAEVHQDFIFNTPGRIGGKPRPFVWVVTGNALDEPDGANGDEILLIRCLGIIFFGRVKQKEEFSRSKTTP